MKDSDFEWDERKNHENFNKHGVWFELAQLAFMDERRIIVEDAAHSGKEQRYYCFGRVEEGILTVRFTMRRHRIRIFGAGFWRKGKKYYEQENKVH